MFLKKSIKATDFKFSRHVHWNLLYATIERHFKIYAKKKFFVDLFEKKNTFFVYKIKIHFLN